jgi:hypothetical protein
MVVLLAMAVQAVLVQQPMEELLILEEMVDQDSFSIMDLLHNLDILRQQFLVHQLHMALVDQFLAVAVVLELAMAEAVEMVFMINSEAPVVRV